MLEAADRGKNAMWGDDSDKEYGPARPTENG
jgi:hypothetical protein